LDEAYGSSKKWQTVEVLHMYMKQNFDCLESLHQQVHHV